MSAAGASDPELLLASSSPRRRELLAQLGLRFACVHPAVDERRRSGEAPRDFVRRMAEEKAQAGRAANPGRLPVLGADTDVVIDGEVLGKPEDFNDARRMLESLSKRSHEVLSAVAVASGDRLRSCLQVSTVSFAEVDEATIAAYWATGEPRDKAGAYAIQGQAAAFISHLRGSFSGVMGLPLHETALLLREFGIRLPRPAP